MTKTSKYLVSTISVLALVYPLTAVADTPPDGEGSPREQKKAMSSSADDIIVTATRRDESILKAPLSITALSQENLDKKGVRNIEDLTRMVPGVSLNQGSFGIKYLVVRGLTSSVGATMNGVYIDDTPVQVRSVSLLTNFYPAMFDLERVEVLRGPQGTLFGAGAMGGAIRFITAKPGLERYSGYARAELGFTKDGAPSYEAGAAIGGPVIEDKIGFRVSGYYRRDGGYINRVPYLVLPQPGTSEKNFNSRDTYVAQAAMTIKPTESLTITPALFYQQANSNGSDQFWQWAPQANLPPLPRLTNGDALPSYNRDRSAIYSVKGEWNIGSATLITNTAFTDRFINNKSDGTGLYLDILGRALEGPLGLGHIGQDGGLLASLLDVDFRDYLKLRMHQRAFTQEVRIQSNPAASRWRYVFGVFYQNSRQTSEEFDTSLNPAGIAGLIPLIPADPNYPGVFSYQLDKMRDRQIAAFGQIDYKLTAKLTLSAGLRYSHTSFNFYNASGLPSVLAVGGGRSSENPITPKFVAEYEASDHLMFYGNVAKGFRPGGANPSSSALTFVETGNPTADAAARATRDACVSGLEKLGYSGFPREYKSDSVWSYEVGAKGRIGNWLTFAGDLFQIDWDNVQRTRTVLACGTGFLVNLGKSRARGVEGKITLTPTNGLSLDANFSYTDATAQQTLVDAAVNKGDRFAPPWIISLAADYEAPVGDGVVGYGHLQWDHRSGMNVPMSAASFSSILSRIFTQDFVAARIGVRIHQTDFSVFVNNLLDSKDELSRLYFGGDRILRGIYRPRTIGMTASQRF